MILKIILKNKMELFNFALLSLNNMISSDMSELSVFIETIEQQQRQDEYIDIMDSQTMKELFINLYLNENPNITFEELKQKLIQFYFEEANENLISRHINDIYDNLHESVVANIHEKIIHRDYNNDINIYNLNALIEFISISEGIGYLQNIYNIYRVMPN